MGFEAKSLVMWFRAWMEKFKACLWGFLSPYYWLDPSFVRYGNEKGSSYQSKEEEKEPLLKISSLQAKLPHDNDQCKAKPKLFVS